MTAIKQYIADLLERCYFEHLDVTVSDRPLDCIRAYSDITDLLETMDRYDCHPEDGRVHELRTIRTNLEQLEYIRVFSRATRAYYARFE